MNDEKETQDITVGSDGMMSTEDKNDEAIQSEGEQGNPVNDVTPPPQDEAVQDTSVPEENSTSDESGGESISVKAQPEETPEEASDINTSPAVHDDAFSEPSQSEDMTNADLSNDATVPVASATSDTSQDQTEHSGQVQAPRDNEHPNNKKFIAFVVVLVAILLMGAAVFVYMSAEDNTAPASTTPAVQEQESEPLAPATESDVDRSVQELDEALNELDDTEDFGDEALSDETLGL